MSDRSGYVHAVQVTVTADEAAAFLRALDDHDLRDLHPRRRVDELTRTVDALASDMVGWLVSLGHEGIEHLADVVDIPHQLEAAAEAIEEGGTTATLAEVVDLAVDDLVDLAGGPLPDITRAAVERVLRVRWADRWAAWEAQWCSTVDDDGATGR